MYQPKPAPMDPAGLGQYVADELQSIAQAQSDKIDTQHFNVLHAAPQRPREGLEAVADGTDWNPGSGAGKYIYLGGAWTLMGGGGGGGATNLGYTASPTNGTVTSDTGTDATLPLADGTNAGLMAPAEHTKLAGISGTNTGDQTITLTGDVTGSGTGSFAATIANAAVTLAKMANMATGSLFYRKTAGAGAPEVQTLATLKTDLGLTGTNSGDQDLSAYAPLASPALTGTPTAPTAAGGTNTTQIATTAFVTSAVSGVGAGLDIFEIQVFS